MFGGRWPSLVYDCYAEGTCNCTISKAVVQKIPELLFCSKRCTPKTPSKPEGRCRGNRTQPGLHISKVGNFTLHVLQAKTCLGVTVEIFRVFTAQPGLGCVLKPSLSVCPACFLFLYRPKQLTINSRKPQLSLR